MFISFNLCIIISLYWGVRGVDHIKAYEGKLHTRYIARVDQKKE